MGSGAPGFEGILGDEGVCDDGGGERRWSGRGGGWGRLLSGDRERVFSEEDFDNGCKTLHGVKVVQETSVIQLHPSHLFSPSCAVVDQVDFIWNWTHFPGQRGVGVIVPVGINRCVALLGYVLQGR
jgi:hypothetical protein